MKKYAILSIGFVLFMFSCVQEKQIPNVEYLKGDSVKVSLIYDDYVTFISYNISFTGKYENTSAYIDSCSKELVRIKERNNKSSRYKENYNTKKLFFTNLSIIASVSFICSAIILLIAFYYKRNQIKSFRRDIKDIEQVANKKFEDLEIEMNKLDSIIKRKENIIDNLRNDFSNVTSQFKAYKVKSEKDQERILKLLEESQTTISDLNALLGIKNIDSVALNSELEKDTNTINTPKRKSKNIIFRKKDMSVQLFNILNKYSIKDTNALFKINRKDFYKLKGVGKRSLKEMDDFLISKGFENNLEQWKS